MGHGNLTAVRAVICDVYGTLIEIEPGPADAEAGWIALWAGCFPDDPAPPVTLAGLDEAVRPLVEAHHRSGRARGLIQPEVDWPALAARVLPALGGLDAGMRGEFFFRHARLLRTTRLIGGVADFLRQARRCGVSLGIASNAQACTRRELGAALDAAAIGPDPFDRELCFYSYEHGVAKPDPAVFSWLLGRLASRGIGPSQTLMVGDRPDNDLHPARAVGWRTWHLTRGPAGPHEGHWAALLEAWGAAKPAATTH